MRNEQSNPQPYSRIQRISLNSPCSHFLSIVLSAYNQFCSIIHVYLEGTRYWAWLVYPLIINDGKDFWTKVWRTICTSTRFQRIHHTPAFIPRRTSHDFLGPAGLLLSNRAWSNISSALLSLLPWLRAGYDSDQVSRIMDFARIPITIMIKTLFLFYWNISRIKFAVLRYRLFLSLR